MNLAANGETGESSAPELDPADIEAAAARLAGVAHRTPVLRSRTLDESTGCAAFLKAEIFQRTGSFKFRGAYNHLDAIGPDGRAQGVVAVSSGNHAQAVALSAALFETPATILMPEDAPAAKRAATLGYGATIVTFHRYRDDREQRAIDLAASLGAALIEPFDHRLTMAGQGTVARELLEDVPDLDTLVVCVGGGGLLAGCATAAKTHDRSIEIIGVEPVSGNDTQRSLAAGRRIEIDVPHTIADGLQIVCPGERTFAVNRRLVDRVVTVTDEELVDTMRFAFDRLRIVLEPSGAAALAALRSGQLETAGRRVGVTLTGGNIDLGRFAELTAN